MFPSLPQLSEAVERAFDRALGRYFAVGQGERAFDRQATVTLGGSGYETVLDFTLDNALPGYITGLACATTGVPDTTTLWLWHVDGKPIFDGEVNHVLSETVKALYLVNIPFGRSGQKPRITVQARDAAAIQVTARVAGYQYTAEGEIRGFRRY